MIAHPLRSLVVTSLAAVTVLPALPASGVVDTQAHASGVTYVARTAVTRLVQSTGNLYWTNNIINEFGPSTSTVYRASKSGTPGGERVLYRETGSSYFGDLAYANVSGTWYGYFSDQGGDGVVRIKRIPLAGGSAITLGTSPRLVGTGDLVTDGTTLFWADIGGVSAMPIGGGPIRSIVVGSVARSLALDATHVYFSTGSTTKRIMSVLKSGGPGTTLIVTNTTVTALFVRSSNPMIFWGESDGSVQAHPVSGGSTTTFQNATSGRYVTSMTADATHVRWSDCTTNGLSCAVRVCTSGTVLTLDGGVFAHDVQGDGTSTYWASADGLKRYSA